MVSSHDYVEKVRALFAGDLFDIRFEFPGPVASDSPVRFIAASSFLAGLRFATKHPKAAVALAKKAETESINHDWPLEPFDWLAYEMKLIETPFVQPDVGDVAKRVIELADQRLELPAVETFAIWPEGFDDERVRWSKYPNNQGGTEGDNCATE